MYFITNKKNRGIFISAPWSSSAAPLRKPQTQPKQMICTVASTKMQNEPTQKSIVSSATVFLLNQITHNEPKAQMIETYAIALPDEIPSASSKNAFAGCNIEIELVIAVRKRRKNHANPIQRPAAPICAKTT